MVEDEENILEKMIDTDDSDSEEKPKKRGRPPKKTQEESDKPSVKDWTNHVLSLLQEEEVDDAGNPTTGGLRRIFEDAMVATLQESVSTVVQAPSSINGEIAVVEHSIRFVDEYGNLKAYGDVGEACREHTESPFNKYLTAVAATRAEGRVLRKAMNLHKVMVAEEGDIVENTFSDEGEISTTQINGIGNLCKKLDVNVLKFINMGATKYEDIKLVSRKKAKAMMAVLNSWQRDKKLIKDNVKGYQENWR